MSAAGRRGSSPISVSISSTMRGRGWAGRSGWTRGGTPVQAAMVRRDAPTLRPWPIPESTSCASPDPNGSAACVGLSDEDAVRRLLPMNSISWMVGHLAWHERLVWLDRAQGLSVEPSLDLVATGQPATSTAAGRDVGGLAARRGARPTCSSTASRRPSLEVPLPHSTRGRVAPAAGSADPAHHLPLLVAHRRGSAVRQILGHTRPRPVRRRPRTASPRTGASRPDRLARPGRVGAR